MTMSVSGKLLLVQGILTNVGGDIVYHYRRPAGMKRYIVWQEEAEDSPFSANNNKQEICLTGSIDLYTPNEYDQMIDNIEAALSQANRIQATISAVQYEDETGLIHYTWTFWVV